MNKNVTHLPQKASPTLVKQANIFADLPAKLIEDFQQEFQLSEWKKGDYFNSTLLTQRFFVVLDGSIEIKQSNPETGREATVDMLYAGDCFDLMVLLDDKPHDVIVSPLTAVKLLSVKLATMRDWLWSYPEFNQQFMPYLAQKMREKEQQASSLVLHDVTTRLSRIILEHINKIKFYTGTKAHEHQHHLVNGLSDETLARMTGSVRQVINKQLQHWKKQDIIDKKRNQLIIKDLEALEKAAKYTDSLTNAPLRKPE
ncbi:MULTISPECIES: Crp/Fnr family transcriptional regulator [unclassified Colwellia]|jgi:CRP-like cAMP-binding protein|uniref:Crp/Fnr family transcriptional regulator n=1 Tax=unclassified Colwellia TaxID=196834 RepID=UPI000D350A15|nr:MULTISPECIES: Crp/Fnr family transcriptional regulator [unclassified Colwellia]AWB57078.1 Crp/Fnr family transcriptional regulator [Colwellia sp. Arc7-D]MBA6415519.1 Crp/Fnr family transcriptional regulator [Colwellia sp. 6M3]|tara:strand:+ start:2962 stop:3729 length:768 start_codon:yes stop_codon:yes gene_type:complete